MSKPGQHPLVKSVKDTLGTSTTAADLSGLNPVPGLGEYVTFAGFISGTVTQPGNTTTTWLLMYLDTQLLSWLVVEGDKVVHTDKITDDDAPSGKRDMIWVQRDAAVGLGSGPQSDPARFLTGEFTRAGDFEASPAGGTRAASTGAFCGANTPLCCTRRSP
jgi:hypothetical protein